MNLASLQTFLTVVQLGNLNRAAEQLNVTQSTVTARLDALEAELGRRLLLRSRRGAVMTKAGFAFQRHAETMLQSWDLARRSVELAEGFSGLLSLACETALWIGLGDRWFADLRSRFPERALEAWPGTTDEIRRWLASGLVDAALSQEPLSGRGFGARLVSRDSIVLVSMLDLKTQAWQSGYIQVDHGAEFRRWHAQYWPDQPVSALAFGSADWALAHLLERGGAAYLPERMLATAVPGLHLVPDAPSFEQSIYLATRDNIETADIEAILADW